MTQRRDFHLPYAPLSTSVLLHCTSQDLNARTHPPCCITISIQEEFQTLEAELRTIIDDQQNCLSQPSYHSAVF